MPRILVIEDEDPIREEVMDWLSFEGYTVEGASNGREALALMQADPPDLILCDIAMPEMDGHEVLIEVRSDLRLSHIPFIFVTAAARHTDLRKGMEMGADDYVTKPFTHAEILNAVRARLAKVADELARYTAQTAALHTALDEERQRQMLKAHLMAIFSQDFRSPLSAILVSSEILRIYEGRLSPERKDKHFNTIDRAAHLLLQMIDDVLLIAELENGTMAYRPEPLDLTDLVHGVVEEFRLVDQGAHELSFPIPEPVPFIGDPQLLRHIVGKLVANAITYSPLHTEIMVSLHPSPAQVHLSVSDQGHGIPLEALPTLFDPFQSEGESRTINRMGLGLPIVRQAVTLHGGTITVESEVNRGAAFTVSLPRSE